MSAQLETTERFLRPIDVDRVRRNYRRMQLQRLIAVGLNAAMVIAVLGAAVTLYHHAQSDARFAVRHVEISGALHTTGDDLQRVVRPYIGMNLFTLDIARIRRDLTSLAWVSRIEIEKSLPDKLRVHVVERAPSALVESDGRIFYVDESGSAFAPLAPSIGDSDLPLITDAAGSELGRCVALLRRLRLSDPDLYARISEIRPIAPHGVMFFDRQLRAPVYANEEDLSAKWRDLHAVVRAEHFAPGEIAYADLRFRGRLIVKPLRPMPAAAFAPRQTSTMEITN